MGERDYQTTPQKRNNNLAGYAIVCFIIGGPLLQFGMIFFPFMTMFPGAWAGPVFIMFAIGLVFVIAGVYFLVQWFNSGQ